MNAAARAVRKQAPASGLSSARATVPPIWGLLPLAIGLALWQIFGTDHSVYAPRPSAWWTEISKLWGDGTLQKALANTAATFLIAFVIASVLGTVLGIVVGHSRFVDRMLGPVLEFFRATPPAAIVPLAVLIAGYTQSMKVGVVVFSAIWPVLLQVRTGTRSLDPLLADVGRVLRLSPVARVVKMTLPALLPSILQGMRIAVSPILIIVLLVEILTRINGLGGEIEQAQQSYDSAAVYGLLVITGVLALLINILVGLVEQLLLRHRPA
jgi:ABC-type nitrate/sulfonate/bicarbonate transport system permease component